MNQPALSADEIVRQAIGLDSDAARRTFLEASCNGDSALRELVDRRIREHLEQPPTVNRSPTAQTPREGGDAVDLPQIGSRIGPYQLIREIGEGGMGVVYLARQSEPIQRDVALKIIKVGMDTRRFVARFESERQMMALLDHPGITKVLDAGSTPAGRPYFVMELVLGEPITRYCDDRRLPVRRRLELFVRVCQAIEHAHQKGVIHRDIKPSNVLVIDQDGRARPKVIDFGIAKATAPRQPNDTAMTRAGDMIGTPLYMSPEQAGSGDIDTRSDIYTLGVVLYELLTGTAPFHNVGSNELQDIREAIRTREPPTASQRIQSLGQTAAEVSAKRDTDVVALRRAIRGELDWILLKCLARDRERRYQSAGELARDVERHLRGEAIDAAAPSYWYRTKKFVSRNRVAVAALAVVAFLLAFVSVFSSIMAVRSRELAKRATEAEQLASARLVDVEHQRDRALAAEKRIAQLEREQRNRLAIQQAASKHNLQMFKGMLADASGKTLPPAGADLELMPLSDYLETNFPGICPESEEVDHTPPPPVAALPPDAPRIISAANSTPDEELQIVVCPEDPECRERVLKNILQQQQAAFGKKDLFVALTLTELGDLMSQRQRWNESAEYFEEAIDVLKEAAEEHPELLRIRENLTNVIKNRGDVQRSIEELKSAKEVLQRIDLEGNLRMFWEKVQESLNSKDPEDAR
jgi:serine/threonine protein kinase